LGFDCGSSNGQKQSINDAFQYVAVPPIRPKRGYGRCKDNKSFLDFQIIRLKSSFATGIDGVLGVCRKMYDPNKAIKVKKIPSSFHNGRRIPTINE
jgi:hypothetical protein